MRLCQDFYSARRFVMVALGSDVSSPTFSSSTALVTSLRTTLSPFTSADSRSPVVNDIPKDFYQSHRLSILLTLTTCHSMYAFPCLLSRSSKNAFLSEHPPSPSSFVSAVISGHSFPSGSVTSPHDLCSITSLSLSSPLVSNSPHPLSPLCICFHSTNQSYKATF